MDKLISENKLLNTRRSFLKGSTLSVLAYLGVSQSQVFAQGVDFKNSNSYDDEELFTEVWNVISANACFMQPFFAGPYFVFVNKNIT